jgi:tripartite-type tricarboxylate transporter receptor subunit TctC
VKDPGALALINLVQSQGDISRLTAGPPGIPADRLGALIGAYRKALEDKDLQARAEKLERPVEPAYGEDVAKAIAKALDQSDETKHLLADALKSDKK